MLAIHENPPCLHPKALSVTDLQGPWWIGHTKGKFERQFARYLGQHDVGYYLPLTSRITFSSGRKRTSLAPLFPSYVFFCGDHDARYAALATNCLCQVIEVADQELLVRELAAIERALAGKVELTPYPFRATGSRCRVTAGPFQGLEGVVAMWCGKTRLILTVSMLGQSASLEIDAELLESIG